MPSSILIPVTLRRGACVLDFFTTITTLGTPLDITLQELRIETLLAATTASRQVLHALARGELEDTAEAERRALWVRPNA